MSTSSITFYSDIDADSQVERLHYYMQGTNLIVGVVNPTGDPPIYATTSEATSTVFNYVRDLERGLPLFTLYDATGTPISNFARVTDLRYIKISALVNVDLAKLPNELTLTSSATLRNLISH